MYIYLLCLHYSYLNELLFFLFFKRYLCSNSLKGTIPTQLGLLTSLTDLYVYLSFMFTLLISKFNYYFLFFKRELYYNSLTGAIPTELGLLTSLSTLYVYLSFTLTLLISQFNYYFYSSKES